MTDIAIVVAMDRNGVIGRDGGLPWRLPADLAHFKRITMGHPLIMGRRTHESIGRTLPGRRNIVLTRSKDYAPAPDAEVARSTEEALALTAGDEQVMVIGGARIYALFLPLACRMHLTLVDAGVEGDVRFPSWERSQWEEVAREGHPADARNPFSFSFVELIRIRP